MDARKTKTKIITTVEKEVHKEKVLPYLFCIAVSSKRIMLSYEMHRSCGG
jgi:hypothetical protein